MTGGFISGCNKGREGAALSSSHLLYVDDTIISTKRKRNNFFISVGSSFGLKPPQG